MVLRCDDKTIDRRAFAMAEGASAPILRGMEGGLFLGVSWTIATANLMLMSLSLAPPQIHAVLLEAITDALAKNTPEEGA